VTVLTSPRWRGEVSFSVMGVMSRAVAAFLAAVIVVPAALADGIPTFLKGEQVTLDAGASQGHPTSFEWYVTPPGGTEPQSPDFMGATVTLTLDTVGQWNIRLLARYAHEVSAGVLYTDDVTQTIKVASVVANLLTPQDPVPLDEAVVLDGSGSRIGAGVTPTVMWRIDGSPVPATWGCDGNLICTVPANTYAETGQHTVTLTLLDGEDPDEYHQDETAGTFDVMDDTLAVDFTWTEDTLIPRRMTFDATLTPPTATPQTTVWDFGDGSAPASYDCQVSNCMTGILHTYGGDGVYTVSVTVTTDTQVETSSSHTVPVGDVPEPPTAEFSVTPPSGLEPMTAADFQSTGSCSGGCSWSWAFGDGTTASGEAVSHAFGRSGTYTVTLTVTNVSGNDTSTSNVEVTSCWAPPVPSVSGTIVPGSACWGDTLVATFPGGTGTEFLWSTGSTGPTADVSIGGAFWASVNDGNGCWGTVDFTVVGVDCGDPSGDANLDGTVDGNDLAAIVLELADGDGDQVPDSGGGIRIAPGADATVDGAVDAADLQVVLDALFANPGE